MIKNTLLSMALVSVALFSSCKKEEEKKDRNADDFFAKENMFFKKGLKEASKVKRDPNAKMTVMTFDRMSHDFGKIKQGDKVTTEFTFTNTGKEDLTIYEAKGSCGCTVPEFPKEPVKPGEKGTIKVQFNSAGKKGDQKKSVYVSANTEKGTEILEITTNISEK